MKCLGLDLFFVFTDTKAVYRIRYAFSFLGITDIAWLAWTGQDEARIFQGFTMDGVSTVAMGMFLFLISWWHGVEDGLSLSMHD